MSMKSIRKQVQTDRAPAPVGPYSQAVRAGQFLFISGQIPLDPATGNMVADGIKPETERVLANLQAVLESEGLSFADVVKTTVFLTDMATFPIMNEAYDKAFGSSRPARATVAVAGLPKAARVEIEAVAMYPGEGA